MEPTPGRLVGGRCLAYFSIEEWGFEQQKKLSFHSKTGYVWICHHFVSDPWLPFCWWNDVEWWFSLYRTDLQVQRSYQKLWRRISFSHPYLYRQVVVYELELLQSFFPAIALIDSILALNGTGDRGHWPEKQDGSKFQNWERFVIRGSSGSMFTPLV